jgi:hypothetical protein
MPEFTLKLIPDEAAVLLRLVNSAFRDTRVEVRRTHHSPAFRENVKKEEDVLRGLLQKLQTVSL